MTSGRSPVKERLIDAALACIQRDGLHYVTIRSVAQKAGVNSAAVNYYFGSKKNLLKDAMTRALENATDNFKIMENPPPGGDFTESFREFLKHNFEGMVNYPEIVRALLYEPFTAGRYEREILNWITGYFESLSGLINKSKKDDEVEDIKFITVQIISSLLFPSMFPNLFSKFFKRKLTDGDMRASYIDCLIRHYFKPSS
jgi:AcrR family transcriptional regulator